MTMYRLSFETIPLSLSVHCHRTNASEEGQAGPLLQYSLVLSVVLDPLQ